MQNRDQMHPQDVRNLIIFAVLSIAMWLAYDHFIARPHAEQMMKAKQAAIAAAEARAPHEILDTAIVKPRADIIAETPRVKIMAKSVTGSINLKGGRLDDVDLADYYKTVDKKDHVETLSPARSPFPRYVETGWIGGEGAPALPGDTTMWAVKGGSTLTPTTPVTITTSLNGMTFERTFTVDDDFGFSITNRVVNGTGKSVKIYPYALTTEHGMPEDFQNLGVIHEGPIAYIGDKLQERTYRAFKKTPEESFTAQKGWMGLTGNTG